MFDLNARDLGRTRDIQKACIYTLSFSRQSVGEQEAIPTN